MLKIFYEVKIDMKKNRLFSYTSLILFAGSPVFFWYMLFSGVHYPLSLLGIILKKDICEDLGILVKALQT